MPALIRLVVSMNSRPELSVTHSKVVESIQTLLKNKFKSVKCHLMGSRSYKIMKGGKATIDIYLDLCKF